MNNVHKKAWLITLPRQVIWLFVILNIIAMFLYPSGTLRDNLSSGYSFTKNFLSDLGRSMTFSGEINFLSSLIFNIAMIISGGALSLFYFKVRKVFNEDNQKVLVLFGSFFGILGGVSIVGVGLAPADLYKDVHVLCANWIFRFMFVASILYTVAIFRHPTFDNKYSGGYLVFAISILSYILISEMGPGSEVSDFALLLQVVSQKMIFLIFMVAIYIQTIGIQKLLK